MHRAQGEADAMGARYGDGVEDVFVTRRDGVGEPATRVAADKITGKFIVLDENEYRLK